MVASNLWKSNPEKLAQLKVGDTVTRLLAGSLPVELIVSEITEDKICCGPWEFHPQTGGEIDEELGWDGGISGPTGSLLVFDE